MRQLRGANEGGGAAWPFQNTVELLMKFEPITTKVKPGPPAGRVGGERETTAGTGLPATEPSMLPLSSVARLRKLTRAVEACVQE